MKANYIFFFFLLIKGIELISSTSTPSLHCGYGFCCIRLYFNTVKCWGDGSSSAIGTGAGVLGIGNTANFGGTPSTMGDNLPTLDFGTNELVDLTTGVRNACYQFSNNKIKCCGAGQYSPYGDSSDRCDSPDEIGDNLPFVNLGTNVSVERFPGFSALAEHICVIVNDGLLKCFGRNFQGNLGLGTSSPANYGSSPETAGDNLPFVNLGTNRKVKFVSLGSFHSCAILDDNSLKCWGMGDCGPSNFGDGSGLGYGDLFNRGDAPNQMGENLPVVNLGTNLYATSLSSGACFNCAILNNKKVKCFGKNNMGQLGLNDTSHRGGSPNQMGDNLPYTELGSNLECEKIVSSVFHTCCLFSNGKVKCWGDNSRGQLGYGDFVLRGNNPNDMGDNLPYVNLGASRTAIEIAALQEGICVILDNFDVKCWGNNLYGELGQGDKVQRGSSLSTIPANIPPIDLGVLSCVYPIIPGFYCDSNLNVILPCVSGTFSTGNATDSHCQTCPGFSCGTCQTGKISNGTGCNPCPASNYCQAGIASSCPSGTYSTGNASDAQCQTCPGFQCGFCPAGTYSNGISCLSCPSTKYCLTGTNTPLSCPQGTFSTGGAQDAKCQTCAGFECGTCSDGAQSFGSGCSVCPASKYCLKGVAFDCPAGSFSTGGAQDAQCKKCPGFECGVCKVGTFSITGSSTCFKCSEGTYSKENAAQCLPCEPNHYCPEASAGILCPFGTFTSMFGNTDKGCDTCPETEKCGQCSDFPGEFLCAAYSAAIAIPVLGSFVVFSLFAYYGIPILQKSRLYVANKRYVSFLSHYKLEAGAEARILKDQLDIALNKRFRGKSIRGKLDVFLDSDNLFNLSTLKDAVQDSNVLIILLSKNVFTRPWCLVEIKSALDHHIPIVPVLLNGKDYNFESSRLFLQQLSEESLEMMNPGCVSALKHEGISIPELGAELSTLIPNLIAKPFNANGGRREIDATVNDIIDSIVQSMNYGTSKSSAIVVQEMSSSAPKVSVAVAKEIHYTRPAALTISSPPMATAVVDIESHPLQNTLETQLLSFFENKKVEKSKEQISDYARRALHHPRGSDLGLKELNASLIKRYQEGLNLENLLVGHSRFDDL